MAAAIAGCLVAFGLVALSLLIVRRLRIGLVEAQLLGSKTAFGHPRSAFEWPECRVVATVGDPEEGALLVVLEWPAHPDRRRSVVLVGDERSLAQIRQWQATGAHVVTTTQTPVVMRRRNSDSSVTVEVLAEDDLPLSRSAKPRSDFG